MIIRINLINERNDFFGRRFVERMPHRRQLIIVNAITASTTVAFTLDIS